MIVYGDRARLECPRALLGSVGRRAPALGRRPAGGALAWRSAAAGLLVDTGELLQGLADHAAAERGCDDEGPLDRLAAALAVAAAEALLRPGAAAAALAAARAARSLAARPLPETITVRVPEGYAHYAVYPELYALAAAPLRGEPLAVIGIRSIGASLAAAVAAGAGAALAITLRPVGHPFARRVRASAGLAERVLAAAGEAGRVAVVDEGPGLSGSSFGAVADWLEAAGAEPERLHFFPSHAGEPGAAASAAHRERWRAAARHVVPFEALLSGPASPLPRSPASPIEDLGAGRWREPLYGDRARWPPVFAAQERRKYRGAGGRGRWIARFAGLGRYGEGKLARARALARAGLGAEVLGLRHGFLVMAWVEGAPLALDAPLDRPAWLDALGAHLAFVARELPATHPGADPAALLSMAKHNAALALGEIAAAALRRWDGEIAGIARRAHPVAIDGRLHAWEWIGRPDGRVLKTDALDHHAAHDLVGAQDIAWDIAGAAVELDLSADERAALATRIEREAGVGACALDLRFYADAYCAFQLGSWTLAAGAAADAAERARIERLCVRYARALHRSLTA